jgi:hypothetical protein
MPVPYSLRGDDAKKRFVREFGPIRCVWHGVFDESQKGETCCCGRDLEDEYFEFAYGSSDDARSTFYAGPECGKKLADVAGIELPPLFDIFVNPTESKMPSHAGTSKTNEPAIHERLPENKEFVEATNLMLYFWKNKAGELQKKRDELIEHPHYKVFDFHLKKLNRAAHSTVLLELEKRGLDNIETLRQLVKNIDDTKKRKKKSFYFPILENRIKGFGDMCYI